MSEPTGYDNEIKTKLLPMIAELQAIQASLYNRRYNRQAGCACDEKSLCAHHAAVSNKLLDSIDLLQDTIREAQRVE